jgi:protein-S-isoprenylcysteine O-methyltransferase Ste14
MTSVVTKRRVLPPVWLLLALAAMWVLDRYVPGGRWVAPPWTVLGYVPMVLGAAIILHSAWLFRRAATPVIPFERSTTIVTDGLYRYTRNPMYLGLATVLVGAAIRFGTFTPWLAVPIFVLVIQKRFIEPEERFLESLFGETYRAYQRRVRRWL